MMQWGQQGCMLLFFAEYKTSVDITKTERFGGGFQIKDVRANNHLSLRRLRAFVSDWVLGWQLPLRHLPAPMLLMQVTGVSFFGLAETGVFVETKMMWSSGSGTGTGEGKGFSSRVEGRATMTPSSTGGPGTCAIVEVGAGAGLADLLTC